MRASPDLRMGIEIVPSPAGILPAMLDALQNHGNSLADTDAHGAERIFAVCTQELVERGGNKPRAAGAQGVPESNRTTVRIHVRSVVRDSQFAQHGQRLRRE